MRASEQDIKNYSKYLSRGKFMIQNYNPEIKLNGWIPLITKDVADFPSIICI